MADYMRHSKNGDPYLDFSKLTRDQAAALIEVTVEDNGEVHRVKFKLADKIRALDALGRHLGIYDKDQLKITGHLTLEQLVTQSLRTGRRRAGGVARGGGVSAARGLSGGWWTSSAAGTLTLAAVVPAAAGGRANSLAVRCRDPGQ
jgi:phage terminase small subunit